MNRHTLVLVAGALLFGCGKKAQETQDAATALKEIAEAGTQVEGAQKEAEQFQKERQAKGDTLAMPYAELQKFLPSAPDGYSQTAEPGGSSQNMTGFSMSQAEQSFEKPAGPDGTVPSLHVTIVDFGGTQTGFGMMALPMMTMNLSMEDAHQRMRTLKLDAPYTWASEEYNKDNKTAKFTAVTRYRFMITVEARNQPDDQSNMVRGVGEGLVAKFAGR